MVHKSGMHASAGRPLEFEPQEALTRAMQVFWRQGYEHTSLDDLLRATGLSKSSLYRTFGGKHELFDQCLTHYADIMSERLQAKLDGASSGLVFISQFLESVLDDVSCPDCARGCLLLNTVNEFAQRDPCVARSVARETERVRVVLEAAVRRAVAEGDLDPKLEPGLGSDYLISAMSGLKTMAKAGADAHRLRGLIRLTLQAMAGEGKQRGAENGGGVPNCTMPKH